MEDFGKAIKEAVSEAKKSGNREQALKELKAFIGKYIENAYDKLDKLSPDVPDGKPTNLLDEAQTDIIHISEGLDDVFAFLLASVGATNRIDDAANRLAGLTRAIDRDEVQSIVKSVRSNGQAIQ